MPERIKNESVEMMSLGSPISESLNVDTPSISVLNDTFMEPLLDSLPSSNFDQEFNAEFNFEFSDHNYRYHDVGTPCSSLSPASSGPLQSPASYSVQPDPPMSSPSPPPTTEDFTEFLQASSAMLKPFEADFSNLTLTGKMGDIFPANDGKLTQCYTFNSKISNSESCMRQLNASKRRIGHTKVVKN